MMRKEEKEQLRAVLRQRRKDLANSGYYTAADTAITDLVLGSALYRAAGSVFCYVSMPGEPDTYRILGDALSAGKAVYVPKCLPGARMLAVRIRSLTELCPGVLSIPEPVRCRESDCAGAGQLDLIIVPCVSVSKNGIRLGHGAGYYDRFLAGTAEDTGAIKDGPKKPVSMCLCYEQLMADDLPADAHDIPMDCVVCESGITRCAHC